MRSYRDQPDYHDGIDGDGDWALGPAFTSVPTEEDSGDEESEEPPPVTCDVPGCGRHVGDCPHPRGYWRVLEDSMRNLYRRRDY